MELKQLHFVALALALFLSVAVVSAAGFDLVTTQGLPSTLTAGSTYTLKVLFNDTNTNFSSVNVSFSGSSDFTLPSDATVDANSETEFVLTVTVPSSASGSFSRTLTAHVKNDSTIVDTQSVTFSGTVSEQTFCEEKGMSDGGDLEINNFDITNNGRGSDDEWDLLDKIEIEVSVENTNRDDDIDDVFIELKIVDSSGNDVTSDFDLDDEEFDVGRIRDDDEETVTFVIPEVPVDIDEGSYDIYVVAYSDDDSSQCISTSNELDNYGSSKLYASIDVQRENDEGIIIKDDELTSMLATCGQKNVQLNLELYNIGDKKEENVLVTLYNAALDVDEKILIENFRDGKKKSVDVFFDIPDDIRKGSYTIDIMTYFDYDDGDEYNINSYDQNSDDDLDETYGLRIDVECDGTTSGTTGSDDSSQQNSVEPIVSAQLVSDSVSVGDEVIIKATLSNPSSEATTFGISIRDYQSWATLVDVVPRVVTLEGGDETDVTITLKPTEAGVHTFELYLENANMNVIQDVSLNVDDSGSSSSVLSGNAISNLFAGGGSMGTIVNVLIVLIIVLLIVILIVAIVRRG